MNDRLPPAPTLAHAPAQWHLDPLCLAVLVVAAVGYAYGLVRVRRAGEHWPVGRAVVFYLVALPILAITGLGWPEVYARVLFSVYAVQVTMLLMVVPFVLALGHPLGLFRLAVGPTGRARLDALLNSRFAKIITVPVVSPILLAVIPYVLFFSPLLGWTLSHGAALSGLHLVLLVIGLAVMIPMWEADTIGARWPYTIALLFAFIELLVDAVPGIIVRLETHVLALSYFTSLSRPYMTGLLGDQRAGGDILWCIGEAIDVPFLFLLIRAWVRSDARDAIEVDSALDARAPHQATAGATADEPDDGLETPWREQNAAIFGDRESQYRRR